MLSRLLHQTVTVEDYLGDGAYGKLYGPERTIEKCRIENSRKVIRDAQGSEVVSETQLFCFPEETIPNESLVTVGGRKTTVLLVTEQFGRAEQSHLEVFLA
jgi:hypothetical protein